MLSFAAECSHPKNAKRLCASDLDMGNSITPVAVIVDGKYVIKI